MELGLTDKVAVVTGGTSGIGLATVRQLLGEGCKVAFCARSAENVDVVGRDLAREFGAGRVLGVAASVLEPRAMADFADAVQSRFGPAQILVTNAGQGRISSFETTTDDDWRQELELKFFSQIHPVRAFREQLGSGRTGAIVAVNSLLAHQPEPHMVCTSAARAGVQNLLKSLANELAPEIRVNSVLLGVIESGQWEARFRARADQGRSRQDWYAAQAAGKHIPLARFGTPDEPARAIVFLASPAAGYITGAGLEISGGTSRFA